MNDLRALPGKAATLIEASVSRAEMESLLARHTEPLVFEACNFDGIGGLHPFDAKLFRGTLISHAQAATLLAAWGLSVV